jgi:predicted phosphodiesterase
LNIFKHNSLIMNRIINKPVLLKGKFLDANKFRPIPPPVGKWPYNLDIKEVEPIVDEKEDELIFHIVGDTGSAKDLSFQRLLALQLIKQAKVGEGKPQFLYHLGDIVYDHGEKQEYPAQFFKPFEDYPGPIFSIPGNHDAEVNLLNESPYQSLDGYMDVFCDSRQRYVKFSEGSSRKSMIQPNVYWTLNTSVATIIGLYGNVAKFGVITEEQKEWFIGELKKHAVDTNHKALIVCLHQSPFSADTNHGSSLAMIEFLEHAYKEAGVKPDVVFSGHVHNYQRFTRTYSDGTTIPYIVAGAGGYAILHPLAKEGNQMISTDSPLLKNVTLENYSFEQYGFLKIRIVRTEAELSLIGEYYTIPLNAKYDRDFDAKLYDRFEILLKQSEMTMC